MNALIILFSFKGNISRAEYWSAIIIWVVFAFFISFIISMFGININTPLMAISSVLFWFSFFALQIKRCHDIGWSGWLSLLSLVPYVNFAWWLVVGTMTKQTIQKWQEKIRIEQERKKEESRRETEKWIKEQQAQERIQRAEDFILNSGDPKAISLLLLARKMPTNYTQILAGGMKNGNSTLKNALAVMTGAVAGNLVATAVSVAAIQDALENMQPEIETMNFDSLDEIELPDEKLVLDTEPDSGFDLSDLLD